MDTLFTIIFLAVFMLVLIFLSGWFSGTETALTNLGPATIAQMKKEGDRNVKYVIKLKRRMDKTLVTILIGNNIVNIVLSSVAALIANELFAELGVSVMIGLITFLVIVFGEITPKNSAIFDSRKKANRNARAIYYLSIIMTPLVHLFIFISGSLIRMTGGATRERRLFSSDDAIKDMASLSEEEGVIKPIERDIIHKVFLFGDRKISDVMVPMASVFHFEKDISTYEARGILSDKGFTRVPVMGKNRKVKGVLYSKDLLTARKGTITPILRNPFLVSVDDDVTDVFDIMKRNRIHIAIVENRTGEHVGIVTLEDLIEELVGEIHDEYFEKKFGKRKNRYDKISS
ncbi:MAG: hemolysin family protein [Thermoplasmatota archaeon]